MKPFRQVEPVTNPKMLEAAKNDPEFAAALEVQDRKFRDGTSTLWVNGTYQVEVDTASELVHPGFLPLIHLSIKRIDRQPIHDWRDLQEIKNQLVGPEHEGMELYPAESRLVDTSNQYHLFVLKDEGRLPFGWTVRKVGTPEEAVKYGAVQR